MTLGLIPENTCQNWGYRARLYYYYYY